MECNSTVDSVGSSWVWLGREFQCCNMNASLSLAGIHCTLQRGNLLTAEGSPDQGWEMLLPWSWRTLPTPPDNQPCARSREMAKGPHAPFAVYQPLRVPCSSASPSLQPERSCVLLCSENEAEVPACRFKLSLKKHGTVLLALWEPSHHQDKQARAACWESEGTTGRGFSPASRRPTPSQTAGNLHVGQQVQPGSPRPNEPTKLSQPTGVGAKSMVVVLKHGVLGNLVTHAVPSLLLPYEGSNISHSNCSFPYKGSEEINSFWELN